MGQFIIMTVVFFGGIIMYIANQLMFKTFNVNHATKVLLFFSSLLPGTGLIIQMCYCIWASCNYQTWGFYAHDMVQIRDSWINRWLFDDVKWNEYDAHKQNVTERAREEVEYNASKKS